MQRKPGQVPAGDSNPLLHVTISTKANSYKLYRSKKADFFVDLDDHINSATKPNSTAQRQVGITLCFVLHVANINVNCQPIAFAPDLCGWHSL